MRFSGEKQQRLDRDFCTDEKGGLSLEERRQPGVGWCGRYSCANPDQERSRAAVMLTTAAPGEDLGGA